MKKTSLKYPIRLLKEELQSLNNRLSHALKIPGSGEITKLLRMITVRETALIRLRWLQSRKSHIRRPVSPCGGYHLSWKKPGKLTVISHVNYKPLLELTENTGTIVRAAFSGNYRRILCRNQDGSVGTWDMTQRKPKISYGGRDIIEYLLNNDPEYAYTLRRISRH